MSTPFRSFAIVPAAGKSERMGCDKLMMPWRKTTVLGSVLDAWQASRVDEIIVIVRKDRPQVIAACESAGVSVVVPDPPPPEMKDSVRAALRYVRSHFCPRDEDVWLLAPADMPLLNPATTNRVIAAHNPQTPRLVAPTQASRRGHPVLFPWPLAEEVASLGAGEGVNVLLQRHLVHTVRGDDDHIHSDVDTPEDYERLRDEASHDTALGWQSTKKPPAN